MINNKIQRIEENRKSVISFDTLVDNGATVETRTIYNVFNEVYSNSKLRDMDLNMTPLDVINRRMCLEEMFKNRVIFLLNNIISEFAKTVHCPCPDVINEYPFIFDIHSYMADISGSTILDYTNLLCSNLYNYAMAEYVLINGTSLNEYNDMVRLVLKQTIIDIYEALSIVYNEVMNVYYPAGLPGVEISFDGE